LGFGPAGQAQMMQNGLFCWWVAGQAEIA